MRSSKEAASQTPPLLLIAVVLYLAQGFPFGIVTELYPIYLRQHHASLEQIGLLSGLSIFWTLKFLWAPLIDRFGSYRLWIRGSLAAITLALAVLSSEPSFQVIWTLLGLIAAASATQDIAIDGLTIILTPIEKMGRINATRITAFRAALIISGGALAAMSTYCGWRATLATAALLTLVMIVFTFQLPVATKSAESAIRLTESLERWVSRPDLLRILPIVLLYKLGDASLQLMIKPFWLDHGHSNAEIGTIITTVGLTFTILGGVVGGMIIDRMGVMRALLWLGLLQAASNIGYALLAQFELPRAAWYGASIIENFTGGLGTAAFLTFLMALCDKKFAATDFAILSALFALTRMIAGSFSGFGAHRLGYAAWFWITVALGVPGLIAVLFSRRYFAGLGVPEDGAVVD